MNNIDVVIQARTGSTRYPNKIFQKLLNKYILDHCIDTLNDCSGIGNIFIATTTNENDDVIEQYCRKRNLLFFRGSERNVLDRFIKTCEKFNLEKILRVCSDNPLLDKFHLNKLIKSFDDNIEYCSYFTKEDEPIITKPIGVFAEGVSKSALLSAKEKCKNDPRSIEHVTYFIYNNPNLFKIKKLTLPKSFNADLRFTIDYPKDLEKVNMVVKKVGSTDINQIFKAYYKNKEIRNLVNDLSSKYLKSFQ